MQRAPVGIRLRALRHARGWTLRDVEQRSGGKFPASTLGSYERGVRKLSPERLAGLCALYETDPHEVVREIPTETVMVVDVDRVHLSDEAELARLCEWIRLVRETTTGPQLELRRQDLERVAAMRGLSYEVLTWQLRSKGLASLRPAHEQTRTPARTTAPRHGDVPAV